MPHTAEKDGEVTREPVYWFVVLDRAMAVGDLAAAMQATEALKALGVHVRYGRPRKSASGGKTTHAS